MNKKIILNALITSIFTAFCCFSFILAISLIKDQRSELFLFLVANSVLLGFAGIYRVIYVK